MPRNMLDSYILYAICFIHILVIAGFTTRGYGCDAACQQKFTLPFPLTNAVGKLPALGWNTWNAHRCEINEMRVLSAANQFVSLGLKKAGYKYINIDDCWSRKQRSASGQVIPDDDKFPHGIVGVSKQIHKLGLKLGIYSDAGTRTCADYPGSLYYEAIDAATFAEWNVDYLKYDNCNIPRNWSDTMPPGGDWYESNSANRYRRMAQALQSQNRSVEFSLCIWGRANVWSWGSKVGHSWRIYDDSQPTWYYITSVMQTNIELYLDNVDFYAHSDMDLMEIGNGQLTIHEQRTHFAAWAFMKSPILLSTDLAKLSNEQVAIITNPELLAFSQDESVGSPAKPFVNIAGETTSPPEFYSGRSSRGIHVFVINTNGLAENKTLDFASVPLLTGKRFMVHDMWTSSDLGEFTVSFTMYLERHDTAALLILPVA